MNPADWFVSSDSKYRWSNPLRWVCRFLDQINYDFSKDNQPPKHVRKLIKNYPKSCEAKHVQSMASSFMHQIYKEGCVGFLNEKHNNENVRNQSKSKELARKR